MWHIKLKGMGSKPGYTENFYPRIKLVTLGWGSKDQIPLDIFESVGMAHHRMCSSYFFVFKVNFVLANFDSFEIPHFVTFHMGLHY